MNHRRTETWLQYVRDELTSAERATCEAHLDSCDACFELCMQCLEQAGDLLPELENQEAFSEAVMIRLEQELPPTRLVDMVPEQSKRKLRIPWIQHPFFHYAVAAAITLILMNTGVFQTLTQQIERFDTAAGKKVEAEAVLHGSVSEKLMNKTIGMLDSIQPRYERGGTHESK
ncbi:MULTISPECIES: zf-HC2 domain-containing protein [unclassified Paenibacillus]|uniref:anti-sigma factor family protein n=1 Tax=unclassified Paenibacillus TaxID=185978 RepID=UPI001AE99B46|nr:MULTISPECIES: zf-HC2 domain-containing protein [unclassified Paenibacillus]MBP1153229.1 anti-sigma factor RsiW [Paenibacillus sp. PvP091]MBP1171388.1 anti-sigma factor RsiW [Paenibacillus sp. PvR098]MBP2442416.1 anti-sigma factor RsiW [Paenibacillus sp. PvP052]